MVNDNFGLYVNCKISWVVIRYEENFGDDYVKTNIVWIGRKCW